MTRNQIITCRLVLLAAVVVITYLATTQQQYPVVRELSDKASHFLAFYVLALLVDYSFPRTNLGIAKLGWLIAYGMMIEVVQSFIPNRTASLIDLAADGMGIALYGLSIPVLKRVPLMNRRWMV